MEHNERKKPLVMFDSEGMHTDSPVIYYGAIILSFMIAYGVFYGFVSVCEWLHTLCC